MPLTHSFNFVFTLDLLLLLVAAALHRQLIEIGEELIVGTLYATVVSNCDTCLVISIDSIAFDLWEA